VATLGKTRWAIGLIVACCVAAMTRGDVPHTSAELKAAYLFNFTTFVQWPSNALPDDQPFRVAICGAPEVADALERLSAGEKVHGHRVEVVRVPRNGEAMDCQMIYLAPAAEPFAGLAQLRNKPVLTAGDDERFEARGGIVRFVGERNRVRLRINLAEAERCGLHISSQLLRIAEVRNAL
jgi:hypothetical protein